MVKRVVTVVVLVAVALVLTKIKDRMPGAVTNFGATPITHVDADTGISFTYPGTYTLTEEGADADGASTRIKTFVLMTREDRASLKTLIDTELPPAITIVAFQNPQALSAEAWLGTTDAQMYTMPVLGTQQARIIDGEQGVTFAGDGLYASDNAVVTRGNTAVLLTGAYSDAQSPQRDVFDDVVGSLLFVR